MVTGMSVTKVTDVSVTMVTGVSVTMVTDVSVTVVTDCLLPWLLTCLLPWLPVCADEWDQWQPGVEDESHGEDGEFNVSYREEYGRYTYVANFSPSPPSSLNMHRWMLSMMAMTCYAQRSERELGLLL